MLRDRRTAAQILAERRWQPLAHRADRLSLTALRDVDRLLKLCETQGVTHVDDVSEALLAQLDAGSKSSTYPHRLSVALSLLLPGTVLATRAARHAARRQTEWRVARKQPTAGRSYVTTKSVPEGDLPSDWRKALADMRSGLASRFDVAPAAKIVETIAMKLRQIARSAQDRNLAVALNLDALAALHEDMNARELSSSTKRATTSALGRFAQYIGAPEEIRAELRRLTAFHDSETRRETKRKDRILAQVDVSAATVLAKAEALLAEAGTLTNPRQALTRRNQAFSLAFFSLLPLRLSDTRLSFGEELTWDGTAWCLRLTTSKTGADYACRIDPFLTRFIDALVLNGLDPAYLEVARQDCLAKKRPVLITVSGEGVGYNYVSDVWRLHFGVGVHIVRTELHESFGIAAGAEGTELALAACAQDSPQSADHYHGTRITKARMAKMQAGMLALAEDLPPEAFAVG